jgi:hypothetical protein
MYKVERGALVPPSSTKDLRANQPLPETSKLAMQGLFILVR